MRNPTLIFSAGFLLFMLSSFLFTDEFDLPLRFKGEGAGVVVDKRAALADVVTGSGEQESKTFTKGFTNYIHVYPGVKLVHDPAAGDKIVLSGPRSMIEAFQEFTGDTELHLDFKHPVKASEYLTVTMDLSAHGDFMHISLAETLEGRSNFPPLLITQNPIEIRALKISQVEDIGPINVRTHQLDLVNSNKPGAIHGTTQFLMWSGEGDHLSAMPDLTVAGAVRNNSRDK